jgi:amino acid transporter
MFWLLAIVSVFIGAVAFAIADFVFLDNDGVSKLQGSSIQDIAQAIPFVWLGVLALFIVSAYYGFRRTRGGYKYAMVTIVLVVVFLSIGLGFILNSFDFGQNTHAFLLNFTSPGTILPIGTEGTN